MSKRSVIENELQAIWDLRGQLTPVDVVQAASTPTHALHGFFEWDDGAAANQYRLGQAATLIRSVKIQFVSESADNIETVQVRGWISGRSAGLEKSGYLPESVVRADPVAQAATLRTMRREMIGAHRRYAHLREFWDLLKELGPTSEEAEAV